MNAQDQTLIAFLTASYPDVLHIARQYGQMYSLSLPNAVRYAVGLLGDNLPDTAKSEILAKVTASENAPANSGFSLSPVMIGVLALGAYLAVK